MIIENQPVVSHVNCFEPIKLPSSSNKIRNHIYNVHQQKERKENRRRITKQK